MRLVFALLLLPLLVCQAHAQTPAAPQVAPALAAAPAAAAPVHDHAAGTHHRMSWQKRFEQANATHDGHLTLQQAKDGYRIVAHHFSEIDAGKKGYVTIDDIAAWHKLQRAMRHPRHEGDSEALRPRPAMQHGMPTPHEINTSTDTSVAPMAPPAAQAPANGDASGAPSRHGT